MCAKIFEVQNKQCKLFVSISSKLSVCFAPFAVIVHRPVNKCTSLFIFIIHDERSGEALGWHYLLLPLQLCESVGVLTLV